LASAALGGAAALGVEGGALGRGILLGALLGAAVAGATMLAEKRLLQSRPERMFHALGAGFLAKLLLVVAVGCGLRFAEPLIPLADWRGFLVAFPLACLIVIATGVFELHSELGRRSELRSRGAR
jgi:hypothetical protein